MPYQTVNYEIPHDALKPKVQELRDSGKWMHMHVPTDIKPNLYRMALCTLVTQTEIQTIRGKETKSLKVLKSRFENEETKTFIQEFQKTVK